MIALASLHAGGCGGSDDASRTSPDTNDAARKTVAAAGTAGAAPSAARDSGSQIAVGYASQAMPRYAQAVRLRFDALSRREDLASQRDVLRLAPVIRLDAGAEGDPRFVATVQRATRLARRLGGADTETAWRQLLQCVNAYGRSCERDWALAHLRKHEPDNAAVWMLSLSGADPSDQTDRYLARAAAAARYDDRGTALLATTLEALARDPSLPALVGQPRAHAVARDDRPERGMLISLLSWNSEALPQPRAFCLDQDHAPLARRREHCLAAARHLAGAQGFRARQAGLTLLLELTAGSADNLQWREPLRTLLWQRSRRSSLDLDALYLAWPRIGEMPAIAEQLAARGESTPPPGWQPEDVQDRELIRTGRPFRRPRPQTSAAATASP